MLDNAIKGTVLMQRLEVAILQKCGSLPRFCRINGLKYGTIYRKFRDRSSIDRETYLTVLECLGMTEEQFLDGHRVEGIGEEEKEVLSMMQRMKPEFRKALRDAALSFANASIA